MKKNKATYVVKNSKIKNTFNIRENIPWTEKQLAMINLLQTKENKCSFIKGPAGTSKTSVCVYSALNELNSKKIGKIYYLRSAVDSSPNGVGFLPGTLAEKTEQYMCPLTEKLDEFLTSQTIKNLTSSGHIESLPTCYLRGRNFSDSIVIIDESQNLILDELITIITRIGEQCRIWFCFDPTQSDLKNGHKKDIVKFTNAFIDEESMYHGISHLEFGIEDIVRSKFCKFVVSKLENIEQ